MDEREEENIISAKIDEEFCMNTDFFEPEECEEAFEAKIKSLLLNKNKR